MNKLSFILYIADEELKGIAGGVGELFDNRIKIIRSPKVTPPGLLTAIYKMPGGTWDRYNFLIAQA